MFFLLVFVTGCSSAIKKERWTELTKDSESQFDKKVVIKEIPDPEPKRPPVPLPSVDSMITVYLPEDDLKPDSNLEFKESEKNKRTSQPKETLPVSQEKPKEQDKLMEVSASGPIESIPEAQTEVVDHSIETPQPSPMRVPEIEDSIGFNGRRPLKDPFRVGERVKLQISYFGVVAGFLTLEVLPFVEVNGRKSYHFVTSIQSNESFEWIYAVDDRAETFVDYEDLRPHTFNLDVKESKQLLQAKSYFDWDKMSSYYWEKRYTKAKGEEEREMEWQVEPFAQNVFSAAFYMRVFQYEPGKELAFRVANKKSNLVFRGKILRRETIDTKVGKIRTIVIKPEFEIGGLFQPVGDIYFWLTDDDRKLVVKIESKIRIGKLVGEVVELQP